MNAYKEMRERHQREINDFPMEFAFSKEQFTIAMKKLGLKPTEEEKVCTIGAGGICRKSDVKRLSDITKRHRDELNSAIQADKTGEGFIRQMFSIELSNHEYAYTESVEDTLAALGLTFEELEKNTSLQRGLDLACQEQKDCF